VSRPWFLRPGEWHTTGARVRGPAVTVPPGLYTVHLKFAELWLAAVGKRPLHVEVNGRRAREGWDPATEAPSRRGTAGRTTP